MMNNDTYYKVGVDFADHCEISDKLSSESEAISLMKEVIKEMKGKGLHGMVWYCMDIYILHKEIV